MKRIIKITITLTLVLAFFFILGSLTEGKKPPRARKLPSEPIWRITQNGTDIPVDWKDHAPNPRFAIYDSGTPTDETDDVVLDKETGLLWERCPSEENGSWYWALEYSYNKYLGGRMGWRLPTIEELASLLVDRNEGALILPAGHPFINLPWGEPRLTRFYSSSNYFYASHLYGLITNVWFLSLTEGDAQLSATDKALSDYCVWCVRGGQGHDSY